MQRLQCKVNYSMHQQFYYHKNFLTSILHVRLASLKWLPRVTLEPDAKDNTISQIFSLGGIVDCRCDLFSDDSRDVATATNFRVKIGKIALFTFIRSLGIPNRIAITPFWFNKFVCDDLAKLCVNLVNFCSVTREFTKVRYVEPSFLSVK